jgi:hypothetical protein
VHAHDMRVLVATLRNSRWVTYLAVAFAVGAALLAIPTAASTPQKHAAGSGDLRIAWTDNDTRLEITGIGFRGKSPADIRVGDEPWATLHADENGTVRTEAPVTTAAAGKSGASVIITGRAPSGSLRTLIAAVPPKASARGLIELVPWYAGIVLTGVLVAAAIGRRQKRRAEGVE